MLCEGMKLDLTSVMNSQVKNVPCTQVLKKVYF